MNHYIAIPAEDRNFLTLDARFIPNEKEFGTVYVLGLNLITTKDKLYHELKNWLIENTYYSLSNLEPTYFIYKTEYLKYDLVLRRENPWNFDFSGNRTELCSNYPNLELLSLSDEEREILWSRLNAK